MAHLELRFEDSFQLIVCIIFVRGDSRWIEVVGNMDMNVTIWNSKWVHFTGWALRHRDGYGDNGVFFFCQPTLPLLWCWQLALAFEAVKVFSLSYL